MKGSVFLFERAMNDEMNDEITTTARSTGQIEANILGLAPKMQEYRLRGFPQEAGAIERQLDRLYAELRAARASRPKELSPNGMKPP